MLETALGAIVEGVREAGEAAERVRVESWVFVFLVGAIAMPPSEKADESGICDRCN